MGFFELAVSDRSDGTLLPLVVTLHGQGGTPADVMSTFFLALPTQEVILVASAAPHQAEEQMLAGVLRWRARPMAWPRYADEGFPRNDIG